MQKYFFIINYLIIILFGIYNYQKIKHSLSLKLFLFFLGYSFLTEVVGTVFAYVLRKNTSIIYNTLFLVNFIFYSYFFYSLLKAKIKKKIVIISLILFLLVFIILGLFYLNYTTQMFRNLIVFGKLLMIVFVLMYFSELLNSNLIMNVKKNMFFWISLGVFLYAIGFIPAYIIGELINYQGIFKYITFILNIFVSICFITGFMISKKEFNV